MNQELIKETQNLLSFESYPGKEKDVSDYVELLMKRLGYRDVTRDEYGSIFGFIGPKQETTAILFDSQLFINKNFKLSSFIIFLNSLFILQADVNY